MTPNHTTRQEVWLLCSLPADFLWHKQKQVVSMSFYGDQRGDPWLATGSWACGLLRHLVVELPTHRAERNYQFVFGYVCTKKPETRFPFPVRKVTNITIIQPSVLRDSRCQ